MQLQVIHLLFCVAGFSLQHLKQAAGSQPSCRIDIDHTLFQLVRNVHCNTKAHLQAKGSMSGIVKVNMNNLFQLNSDSGRCIFLFYGRTGNSKKEWIYEAEIISDGEVR